MLKRGQAAGDKVQLIKAQGATEYLILLAVVLVIALVAIALLGFFPGTATDTKMTENQIYWKSASPLQIETSNAYTHAHNTALTLIHMKIKNAGVYPVRLSKVVGLGNPATSYIDSADWTIHDLTEIYIGPGETACIGANVYSCPEHYMLFIPSSGGGLYIGADSQCDTSGNGNLMVKNFGFEYIQYIEGQQITKKQVGKDLLVKCGGLCPGSC